MHHSGNQSLPGVESFKALIRKDKSTMFDSNEQSNIVIRMGICCITLKAGERQK